ncbi:MAG: protein translocase subunit SecD [Patescibacteria group bacterium]
MPKTKTYIFILFIFILAGSAGFFVLSKKRPFKLGLDLQGGAHLIYQADLSGVSSREKSGKMEDLRDLIERRINIFGVAEPVVQITGERLLVDIAGVEPSAAIAQIGETPLLEFKELTSIKIQKQDQKVETFNEEKKEEEFFAWKNTELSGEHFKRADISFDQTTGAITIQLEFTSEGAKVFEEVTARNTGKPLAIFLDGKSIIDTTEDNKITDEDLYSPVVQEKITGGKAVITGEKNIERARQIVSRLKSGALPVPISLISQQSVGPTLGRVSLEESLRAGVIGLAALILLLISFYRLPGFFASLALGIYLILILALFKLIPVTLTLAGIAGVILSLGIAVDANILIFSRMREELRKGLSFPAALEEGFKRAWTAIRDGNLTALIVALILFSFGSSFVKGFALTLIIGILLSMFSAIIVTKNFLKIFEKTKFEKFTWLWR